MLLTALRGVAAAALATIVSPDLKEHALRPALPRMPSEMIDFGLGAMKRPRFRVETSELIEPRVQLQMYRCAHLCNLLASPPRLVRPHAGPLS